MNSSPSSLSFWLENLYGLALGFTSSEHLCQSNKHTTLYSQMKLWTLGGAYSYIFVDVTGTRRQQIGNPEVWLSNEEKHVIVEIGVGESTRGPPLSHKHQWWATTDNSPWTTKTRLFSFTLSFSPAAFSILRMIDWGSIKIIKYKKSRGGG